MVQENYKTTTQQDSTKQAQKKEREEENILRFNILWSSQIFNTERKNAAIFRAVPCSFDPKKKPESKDAKERSGEQERKASASDLRWWINVSISNNVIENSSPC